MHTQVLFSSYRYEFARPLGKRHQMFLNALGQVKYGQLKLVTPEGRQLIFRGSEPAPVADWRLHEWSALDDFIDRGDIGLGESYVEGKWDSSNLGELIEFGLKNTARLEEFFHGRPLQAMWMGLKRLLLKNSLSGSRRNIAAHYNLGNDFYRLWLDKSMTYSCALFEGDSARSLEEAQQAKYARILRKLRVKPGQHILEIGCGWGAFAETAALHGCKVTAITLSEPQANYSHQRIRQAGLDKLVTVSLMDYRAVEGQFDHIVSIGMFEHVGEEYWPTYFGCIKKCLKPGGKTMIQTITLDESLFDKLRNKGGFIELYIFPGGMLPSQTRFAAAAQKAGLSCNSMFAFGQDYAITLSHWLKRFESQLPRVRGLGYDEKFIRLWRFYLCSCMASFRSGRTSVMQAELTHARM